MSTKLYHRDIGIPSLDGIKGLCNVSWHLHYTGHAMRECVHDKHGIIRMPPQAVTFSWRDIVEVEVCPQPERFAPCPAFGIKKLVVRIPYDGDRDLLIVLASFEPGVRECRVKSVWTNLKTDTHATLDTQRYANPE